MIVVRPCRPADLPGIEKLVNESAPGLSALSSNRTKLREKTGLSWRSFAGEEAVADKALYLFVLEDTANREIIGTSGIEAHAGSGSPFYNYRLDELIHASPRLNVYKEVEILYLTHELTGISRLCSLSISPRYQKTAFFDLLYRARFMFMQLHADKFSQRVIAEIQGVQDDDGTSPFWESLGRHFFKMDFVTANYYSSIKSTTFIAEMMPFHPIYVPLLTPQAREVISQPHKDAAADCELLKREGFQRSHHIDIFDGGPTFEATQSDLLTAKALHFKQVKLSEQRSGLQYLVSNTGLKDFRATITRLTEGTGDLVRIDQQVAEALEVAEDDDITCLALATATD